MTSNGGGDDEFRQVNHVKDELRIREVDENVKKGGDAGVVHWERFLHVRSIKVMLVENDDCTRHIVTALLRNCNYEVIEAANGFQAWKILEDLSNHIDIVLTEVVMPSVSGIGLLCKIMSHKTRKHIPVIMMSSHDSMGLVFKCLSKGAVDFLLKPIRKNELKNLWQHVWRRCHSSSGSGSGSVSGTHAQKSVNSKSCLRSDDSISIIGDDIGSTGDGSDTGSGTQSSWTKQAVELESPQAASPCDQITEHPDSTCGLVIHSAQTLETRDFHDLEGQPDDVGRAGLEDSNIQTEFPVKVPNINNGIQAVDLRLIAKGDDVDMRGPNPVNQEFEVIKEPKKTLDANMKIIDDSNGVISSKISGVKDDGREVQNRRSILRHFELSAFTRYNTTSNAIKTRITASSSRLDNRSEIMKKDSTRDAHSDGYLIYRGSNEQPVPRKSEPQVHHIHHHHHVHHYHKIEPEPPGSNHEDSGLNQLGAGGSSNGSGEAGSKHGSNGQNGSGSAVNLEGTNVESGGGLARTNGGSGSENRIDQHKSAHREAALMKFREKRKDHCFQKKVRYQNRKRLA